MTYFQRFNKYRHINTLDTDLVVLIAQELGNEILIRGFLTNRHYPGITYDIEVYHIKKSDIWKWHYVHS